MNLQHVNLAAQLVEHLLRSKSLSPIHRHILERWSKALLYHVGDDGTVPTEALVFALPAEARAALGLLIAGDVLVWPDLVADTPDEEEVPEPAPRPVPAQPEVPPAAVRMLERTERRDEVAERLGAAKDRLRELAQRHPDAVLEAKLEAALASTDLADVEAEIVDLTMRAIG